MRIASEIRVLYRITLGYVSNEATSISSGNTGGSLAIDERMISKQKDV